MLPTMLKYYMTFLNYIPLDSSEESKQLRKNSLLQLVEKAPGNLVPQLSLTDIYIRDGEMDKAVEQLEIIHKQFPEFPKEAVDYFNKTLAFLKKKDKDNAIHSIYNFS